jgi:hypothetical protein
MSHPLSEETVAMNDAIAGKTMRLPVRCQSNLLLDSCDLFALCA